MSFNDGNCLWVRGIPPECQEEDLLKLFRSYGRVTNVRIPANPLTKIHKGYAFVTMTNNDEARACIRALHGAELGGSGLLVEVSKRSAPHAKTPGIYLGDAKSAGGAALRRRSGEGLSIAAGRRAHSSEQVQPGLVPRDVDGGAVAEPLSEPAASCAALMPASCAVALHRREPLEPVTEPGGEPLIEEEPTPPPPASPEKEKVRQRLSCPGDAVKSRFRADLAGSDGSLKGVQRGKLLDSRSGHLLETRGLSGCGGRALSSQESPRTRISQLEAANVRAAAQQTADSLLLQFQRQGFSDPRAAASECLKTSLELLGCPHGTTKDLQLDSKDMTGSLEYPLGSGPQVLLGPDEFKNPSGFLRVYGDPLAAAGSKRRDCGSFRGPESLQDGNWRCEECSNVNFPRRQRCNKCQAVRGPTGDAIVLQYSLRVYEMLLKGQGKMLD